MLKAGGIDRKEGTPTQRSKCSLNLSGVDLPPVVAPNGPLYEQLGRINDYVSMVIFPIDASAAKGKRRLWD